MDEHADSANIPARVTPAIRRSILIYLQQRRTPREVARLAGQHVSPYVVETIAADLAAEELLRLSGEKEA